MAFILRGINSLEQHLVRLSTNPDDYRPGHCPYCGKSGLQHHGCYTRQADREHGSHDSLNPVPIPRFHLFLQALPQNMFNAAPMYCAETMVSMAHTANCFDNGFEGIVFGSNRKRAAAEAPYDQTLERMVEGDIQGV